MLTASRERGVIGGREIDAQHPEDRGQDALGLTQRSVEDETERQGGFDGEIGILELPAPPADASRCPRGDRVGREPEGDVASPHEGSVVLGPVPDAILCLVLRMHSRLHSEIMTRLRSRWSTCRPLLAHRAESAHQRHAETLQGFVTADTAHGATVYTDGERAYEGLPCRHESVHHSVGEYVRDQAHTNGIESFWALLKRGYHGTYHQMSPKHLHRYVTEFEGRYNLRPLDTIDQMAVIVRGMDQKRLRYVDLTTPVT